MTASELLDRLAADLKAARPEHFSIGLMVGRVREIQTAMEASAGEVTDNGQANTCPHGSATGVDTTAVGPGKIWRCDHCGLTYTDGGDGRRAARLQPAIEAAEEKHRREWADWLESWEGAIGPKPQTIPAVINWLRADHRPFGSAAPTSEPT